MNMHYYLIKLIRLEARLIISFEEDSGKAFKNAKDVP